MNYPSLDKARRLRRATETQNTLQERIDRYGDNINYWNKYPECDPNGTSRRFAGKMLRSDIIERNNLRSHADY
jgi:hypothetical protein